MFCYYFTISVRLMVLCPRYNGVLSANSVLRCEFLCIVDELLLVEVLMFLVFVCCLLS